MTFGQRLKKIRREANMTQERLAEHLGVTPQAVSRWENDAVMPDITLLPAFANLFGVTTDTLLGVDITKRDEAIKDIVSRAWDEYRCGTDVVRPHKEMHQYIGRAVEIVENGLKLYPDSWKLKENLIRFRVAFFDEDIDAVRANQRRTVGLCEDIIENCGDNNLREFAIDTFCTFSRVLGLTERAKELVNQMPHMSLSKEFKLLEVLEGEELRRFSVFMISKMLAKISYCICCLTNDLNMPADEVLELERRSAELYRVMYGNDDYSVMYPPYSNAYALADKLAERGDLDNAFAVLEEEYERMVALSEREYKNISPYLHENADGAYRAERSVKEWREAFCWRIDNDHLPFLRNDFTDEFRADTRYSAFISKLVEYKNKYE